MEQTTRKYAGVPLPAWYSDVCINKSSCLVAAICPGRGPALRTSSSTFISPEIDVEDHAAPCVYPSGVCTIVSKVDQPPMVPSAVVPSAKKRLENEPSPLLSKPGPQAHQSIVYSCISPWLASQQRGAKRWKVVPRRSVAGFTDGEGDTAFCLVGNLECQGLRPRHRPVCVDSIP